MMNRMGRMRLSDMVADYQASNAPMQTQAVQTLPTQQPVQGVPAQSIGLPTANLQPGVQSGYVPSYGSLAGLARMYAF